MSIGSYPPIPANASSVYGPVKSWRFGRSLGIDMIVRSSICSFNCVYCQLGNIVHVTSEQAVYVPTEKLIDDLARVDWNGVDIVTFSGSGEPTMALNLGEVVHHIKQRHRKPVLVLTNATWLHDEATRRRLDEVDIVDCKLDAASEATLQLFNRPAGDVSLAKILEGIRALRREFRGRLCIQCMFMPMNQEDGLALADMVADLSPDEVHINTPRRPKPRSWYLGSRGNHEGKAPVAETPLRLVTEDAVAGVIARLRERLPGAVVRSVFDQQP